MKKFSLNPEFGYHTWRDIGGLFGLFLDLAFCVFVVFAGILMVAFCTVLVLLNYLSAPIWAAMSWFDQHQSKVSSRPPVPELQLRPKHC
jgi:hypothetical protein